MRLDFLNINMERYTDASKKAKTAEIFRRIFRAYWKLFPWRLPLTTDPTRAPDAPPIEAVTPVDEEEEEEVSGAKEQLGDVERAAKAEVVKQIEKVSTFWFIRDEG
jgi:hypothetical protein